MSQLNYRAALVFALLFASTSAVAGTLSYVPISNDADSGISSANTYTHAIDFGSSPLAAINGVNFVGGFNTPSGAITNLGSTNISTVHGGNGTHNVSGNLVNLMTDMNFNTANGLITLRGLTPGQTYDFRLYNRQWSTFDRSQVFSFHEGGSTTANASVTLNPDDASASPPGLAMANTANYMNYQFTARGSNMVVRVDQAGGGTYHMYGLTNQQVGPNAALDYTSISGLFNTGVDGAGNPLPGGANDPHWTVTGSNSAAVVVSSPPGAWIANDTSSKWISTVDSGVQIGNQTYSTSFFIDATADLSTAFIDARLAADGTVSSATINGESILLTSPPGFSSWLDFTISDGLQHGLNTLSFTVPNGTGGGGDFGGFRLQFLDSGFVAVVPEPATFATWSLLGVGIAFAAGRRFRRK